MNECEFCGRGTFNPRCYPCEHAWQLVDGNEFVLAKMLDAAQRGNIDDILKQAKIRAQTHTH